MSDNTKFPGGNEEWQKICKQLQDTGATDFETAIALMSPADLRRLKESLHYCTATVGGLEVRKENQNGGKH